MFSGTVRSVQPFQAGGSVFTNYVFDQVRYVKGAGPDSGVMLTQEGGPTEGVEDTPGFEAGRRYVVLATSWKGRLSAMGSGTWHPFGIWPDSGYAYPAVHIGDASMASLDEQHIVLVTSERWPSGSGAMQSLHELLQASDTTVEYQEEKMWMPGLGWSNDLLRAFFLRRDQDPGTRVTEDALLQRLSAIVALQARLDADSTNSRRSRNE